MCGYVTSLSSKLQSLPPSSPFRIDLIDLTDQLVTKLYNLGVIDGKGSLEKADRVSVSGFCRRRLPVVMVRLKMSQTLQAAITLIETGQVMGRNGMLRPLGANAS
jgi:U3 small nucleolar ribonucleoprotein protein IMP3